MIIIMSVQFSVSVVLDENRQADPLKYLSKHGNTVELKTVREGRTQDIVE